MFLVQLPVLDLYRQRELQIGCRLQNIVIDVDQNVLGDAIPLEARSFLPSNSKSLNCYPGPLDSIRSCVLSLQYTGVRNSVLVSCR